MGRVLSYLMFGFFVCTSIMSVSVLRSKEKLGIENILFAAFSTGSSVWSLFFGFLWIQTDINLAYYCRCAGMIGMFAYMIFSTLLMARWTELNTWWIKIIKIFPFTGIILYPFLMQRYNAIFGMSSFGMSYVFEPTLCNTLYSAYCVAIAAELLCLELLLCTNKKRKWIRVMGRRLLGCEAVIVVGMALDTIMPMFGFDAFPGSSLSQFLGAVLIYRVFLFNNRNRVTLNNVSQFVYYSVESPVLIYDAEQHLKIANKSAMEFFAFPKDHENFSLDRLFDVDKGILQSANVLFKVDVRCKFNDAHCRLDINKIIDVYNEVLGYIIIVDDLTDKIRIIEELEVARKSADMANRAKSTFLAHMSHEIRTPLNTVLGMNEMIIREEKSEKILAYADYIKSAGATLLGIINDILDLSKLEAGKIKVMPDEYNLKEMLHDIINLVTLKMREKGLKFRLDIPKGMPVILYGDQLRIKQIVANIVNNAVKYTEEGCITLNVRWEEKCDDVIELTFSVQDTGRGIKKEDIERIFTPFERAEERKSYAIEGNGLGLAITRQLLGLMGGELTVESIYGEGSTFSARLPQKVIHREGTIGNIKKKMEDLPGHLVAPDIHILVVDDMETNRIVVQELLRITRIHVDMADGGQNCIEMIKHVKYDLIFLDHMMPEMDGIETLHHIREMQDTPNVDTPVIAMTANAVVGAKEMYLNEGFNGYISKPINYTELENTIKNYI